MNALRQALIDYLAVRRVLGYRLDRAEKLLAQFLTYLEDHGESHLTTETALAWATLPAGAHRSWLSTRLSVVRRFATHLRGIDPATEVPPADLLPGRTCRATPYLYSEEDIAALITTAATLRVTPESDLSNFDRPAGCDRDANWGSDWSRPRRLRCDRRPAHHPPRKVRQIPRVAVASEQRDCPLRLSAPH